MIATSSSTARVLQRGRPAALVLDVGRKQADPEHVFFLPKQKASAARSKSLLKQMFAQQRKARGSRDASSVQMVFAVPNIHVSAAAGQCRLPQRYVGVLQEEGTRRLDVVSFASSGRVRRMPVATRLSGRKRRCRRELGPAAVPLMPCRRCGH